MFGLLHGFLGQKEDWEDLLPHLSGGVCPLDLVNYRTIEEIDAALPPCHLIGYSAGGRLSLALKTLKPEKYEKCIILSGHPGLSDPVERISRLESDLKLADELEKNFPQFLETWYNSELFVSLKQHPAFPKIWERRIRQNPQKVADFLRTFSMGLIPPSPLFPGTLFVYGVKDLKYAELYRTLPARGILDSGHAPHIENPQATASVIREWIYDSSCRKDLH